MCSMNEAIKVDITPKERSGREKACKRELGSIYLGGKRRVDQRNGRRTRRVCHRCRKKAYSQVEEGRAGGK